MLTKDTLTTDTPDTDDTGLDARARDELARDDEVFVRPWEREWPKPWMGLFLEALSAQPTVTSSCAYAGVSKKTVYRWRNASPPFAEAWDLALQIERDSFERNVRRWASTGLPIIETRTEKEFDADGKVVKERTVTVEKAIRSERLAELWMRAHYGDRYKPVSRVESTGADGGPVEIQTVDAIDAQVAKLRAELEERSRLQGSPPPPDEASRDEAIDAEGDITGRR